MSDNQLRKAGALHWPEENRIDIVGTNGNDGLHYGMKKYRLAGMDSESKKHLQCDLVAKNMSQALFMFVEWLNKQGFKFEDMCEFDASEVA